MLPRPSGRRGRPFSEARTMVEAIIYRVKVRETNPVMWAV
ncbi:hypothetical protein [Tsukamurella sp. PLM1]